MLENRGETKISRRTLLKLAGVGAVAALAEGCLFLAGKLNPGAPAETLFSPSTDETVEKILAQYGFQEEPVREMIQEKGLKEADYGTLATAAVSVISLWLAKEKDQSVYALGSGGLTEYNGDYFLVTATHVLALWLTGPTHDVHFNLPGLEYPFKGRPTAVYTLTDSPQIDKDEPIFIRLSGEIIPAIQKLIGRGRLNPLSPRLYSPTTNPDNYLFRFQGNHPDLYRLATQGVDQSANVRRYNATIVTGENVVCGGVSGSPILRKAGDDPVNQFTGILTHSSGGGENGDKLGVMASSCRKNFQYSSFPEGGFPARMNRRKTLVE